ncbi:MAG: BrnT family toxin [Gammaproteobacteria bacterium]|nr:BrnT family toxin [Gammaproteobacteria bacterium]
MEGCYFVNGIEFVWDLEKARRNVLKHGVEFRQAVHVLFDPFVRIVNAGVEEEVRDAAVGFDNRWNLLYVVHVVLEGESIRIISARKATSVERRHYED